MTKSGKPLPEKCCAKCGFLYGLANNAATPVDAVFDPDLIRSPSYPPRQGEKAGYPPTVVASRPYTMQTEHLDNPQGFMEGKNAQCTVKHAVARHTWSNTAELCCYLNKIDPLSTVGPVQDPAASVPWHWVATAIRCDRKDCDGFFPYHPGCTPAQHIELRLEQQRAQRAERSERALAKWSAEQEERLATWSGEREGRWKKIETRLTVSMILLTVLVLCFAAAEAIGTLISALVDMGVLP